jgi:multimeric flavodoxin WrbA
LPQILCTGAKEDVMSRAVAVNGSPRMEKGCTAMVLAPFIEGMTEAGCEVELFYAGRLKIKPCACGEMYCWYKKPGQCCIKDDMELLYPRLREADTLVLATPVYIPLPGGMQDVINRLCPLMKPLLETRQGRTRGRFREDVGIRRIVLVSTGGWWEKANLDTVVRIARELAEDASVEFAGAVLRPHAFVMTDGEQLTKDGEAVLEAARKAGYELVKDGVMNQETLEAVSRPLSGEAELLRRFNRMV